MCVVFIIDMFFHMLMTVYVVMSKKILHIVVMIFMIFIKLNIKITTVKT